MPTLHAVPGTEQIVGGTTFFAPMGEAVIVAGIAQRDRDVREATALQRLSPYLRICPARRAMYRVAPHAGMAAVSEVLDALHGALTRNLRFPNRVRAYRWEDVKCHRGTTEEQLAVSWGQSDSAWDLGTDLARFVGDGAPWLRNLGDLAEAMPLSLYLGAVQRRLRVAMKMHSRATSDDIVEAAVRGLRLTGTWPQGRVTELVDDDLVSKERAVDDAMDACGRNRFRRRGGKGLQAGDYKALAVLSLDGRLPAGWPRDTVDVAPVLVRLRTAQRRRRQPHGEAEKRFATYWSRPWTVPFPDESFVCARTWQDVAWELAKWIRTRRFLRKRWALGGGRHAIEHPTGLLPLTTLWTPFHFLGGRHDVSGLRLVGPLRDLLRRHPGTPFCWLSTSIATEALDQARVAHDLKAQAALLRLAKFLRRLRTPLDPGPGPVLAKAPDTEAR